MTSRDNPLYWSFPLGSWFATQVRVSVFFPLIVLVLCFRLYDETLGIELGLLTSAVLFVSVLLHEFGHVFAARSTGGSGDEILIWPLGGLASVRTAETLHSRLVTAAAGPGVNLVICLVTALSVWESGHTVDALHPFVMPAVTLSDGYLGDLMVIAFTVNWVLLLVNLIPVFPLDGGRMLQALLSDRLGAGHGNEVYIKAGTICAVLIMIAGLLFDLTALVFIGAIVLVLNFQESIRQQMMESYDDSFMGYDFSQGYSSLDSGEEPVETSVEPRPGILARWRDRRRRQRELRQQERDAAVELELDQILEKVHTQGLEALTRAERSLLDRASAKFQQRGRDT